MPLYNIVIHFEVFLRSSLNVFFFFFTICFCFFLGPTCVYKFKSCNVISIHGFFQVNALCFLHVRNFKFFILGLLLSFFYFLFFNHVQAFSSSFHCTF
jgi:hypothetical protein